MGDMALITLPAVALTIIVYRCGLVAVIARPLRTGNRVPGADALG